MQVIKHKKNKINPHILDIFLALDFEDQKLYDGNQQMKGINMAGMTNEANVFLSHLKCLGVEDLPTAGELVEGWRTF